MNKILMLLENNIDNDERVQKTCISLCNSGHEVHLISLIVNKLKIKFSYNNLKVYPFYIKKVLYNKLIATCLLQPIYFNLWKKKIHSIIDSSFKSIYVHDLPLIKVGFYFKKKYNLKLISDQHEYYSEFIKNAQHLDNNIGKIIKHLSNWSKYEIKYLNKSDLVVSVLNPLCDLYRKKLNLNKSRIICLPNTPLKKNYLNFQIKENIINKYFNGKENRVIFICSSISVDRNINLMIDAIPLIIKEVPNFKFMILGGLNKHYDLIGHIKKNNVENHIEYIGFVPNNDIPQYLYCSTIGLNIHNLNAGKEVHETVFTKFYQYLAIENIIVTTNLREMAKIVNDNNIGLVVKESSQDIADAIIKLLTNTTLLNSLKENFNKLDNIYWEDTSKEWMKSIDNLLK